MKDISLKLGAVAIAVIATTGIIATASNAHSGKDSFGKMEERMSEFSEERMGKMGNEEKEKMHMNMKMSDQEMKNMMEFHKLMKERKFNEAMKFAENSQPYMFDEMNHKKMMKKHHSSEKREAIKSAFESNDYNAWLKAVGKDSKKAEIVTEDKFPQLVKAHNLMKEAMEIRAELGLDK
jgi:hypothetical protein